MKPFSPLGTEVLTILHRSPRLDDTGKPVVDLYGLQQPAPVPSTVVPGCSVRLLSSDEKNTNVNPTDLLARARFPLTTVANGEAVPVVIDSQAAFTWDKMPGGMFEVQGDPRLEDDVSGDPDHIAVTARFRKG